MNTTENNKLIAEFMGYVLRGVNTYEYNNKLHLIEDLKFHSDWNWLMEVVEKINLNKNHYIAIDVIAEKRGKFCSEAYGCQDFTKQSRNLIISCESDTLIQTVYNACVEFIKWYNQNSAKENETES